MFIVLLSSFLSFERLQLQVKKTATDFKPLNDLYNYASD